MKYSITVGKRLDSYHESFLVALQRYREIADKRIRVCLKKNDHILFDNSQRHTIRRIDRHPRLPLVSRRIK